MNDSYDVLHEGNLVDVFDWDSREVVDSRVVYGWSATHHKPIIVEFWAEGGKEGLLEVVADIEEELGVELVSTPGGWSEAHFKFQDVSKTAFWAVLLFAKSLMKGKRKRTRKEKKRGKRIGRGCTEGDPARNASNWSRIDPNVWLLLREIKIGVVSLEDDPGDGSVHYWLGGRIHKATKNTRQQVTVFLDGDTGYIDLPKDPYTGIGKGVAGPKSVIPNWVGPEVDLLVNQNFIKGREVKPGEVLTGRLYAQSANLEHKTPVLCNIPVQAITRTLGLMTDKGFKTILSAVKDMGDRIEASTSSWEEVCNSVRGQGLEVFDNTVILTDLGLPVKARHMSTLIASVLKKELRVKLMGLVFYAFSSPDLEGFDVRVPYECLKEFPVGTMLGGALKSPTITTEFTPPIKVVGGAPGFECSLQLLKYLVGDEDGDRITVPLTPLIGLRAFMSRWKAVQDYIGGEIEDNLDMSDDVVSIGTANVKAIESKAAIPLTDVALTGIIFDDLPDKAARWINAAIDLQQNADAAKKPIEVVVPEISSTPAVYKLLGRKFRTVEQYNALLESAKKEEIDRPGRLGEFTRAVIAVLPTFVLPNREMDSPFYTPNEKELAIAKHLGEDVRELFKEDYLTKEICEPARPLLKPYVSVRQGIRNGAISIIDDYELSVKALQDAKDERARTKAGNMLRDQFLNIAGSNDPVIGEAMSYVAANILMGNPLKLLGSVRILAALPDKVGSYDLKAMVAAWKDLTGYEPAYFYARVYQ